MNEKFTLNYNTLLISSIFIKNRIEEKIQKILKYIAYKTSLNFTLLAFEKNYRI